MNCEEPLPMAEQPSLQDCRQSCPYLLNLLAEINEISANVRTTGLRAMHIVELLNNISDGLETATSGLSIASLEASKQSELAQAELLDFCCEGLKSYKSDVENSCSIGPQHFKAELTDGRHIDVVVCGSSRTPNEVQMDEVVKVMFREA